MTFSAILLFALAIGVALLLPVAGVWLAIHVVRAVTWLLAGLFGALGWVIQHALRFLSGMVSDAAQAIGSLVTAAFMVPLILANLVLLRFKAVGHYGRAFEDAVYALIISVYRVVLGHPLRLVGLGAVSDSIEVKAPALFAEEPRTAAAGALPKTRTHTPSTPSFDGYKVERELRAGGSGARLFLAHASRAKANELAGRGVAVPDQVVIKAFDRRFGSTIPQIVRESRALEAARGLGLVLEHITEEDTFHYVMPFVPGHDLDVETRRLHGLSGDAGLGRPEIALALGYARDLCENLSRFHEGGLWHKDIKPSNLLVADGQLRVVDFGLVTPLESALTLTTHGTEFFRDPELVRLALAGKRVQDVDGVKFDLYSAGAVLYSMVENSFPAHGSLSSINKEAPEGLRWIVRRSMADVDKRYASAKEMLADVVALLAAPDPYKVPLAALPSVSGAPAPTMAPPVMDPPGSPAPAAAAEDVKRFSAFGFTAEIGGLGAAARSIAGARERLASKRAQLAGRKEAARRERELKAEAAAQARSLERDERRRRRRSAVRGFSFAACVLIIVMQLGQMGMAPPESPADRAQAVAQGATAEPLPIPQEVLALGMEGSRVLLFSEGDDRELAGLSILYADALASTNITPLGVSMDDVEGLELRSQARYRVDSSGPSDRVQRRALQNLIHEVPTLDGIHWLRRDDQGEVILWLLTAEDTWGQTKLDRPKAEASPASPAAPSSATRPDTREQTDGRG